MKLKPWLNGLGYNFGDWELMRRDGGGWSATHRPKSFGGVAAVGEGATCVAAIANAKPTPEYTQHRERVASATRRGVTLGALRALIARS